MGSSKEVADKLPGLSFTVVEFSTNPNARGVGIGRIHLRCEHTDKDMFAHAVEKLDGLKIFSTLESEFIEALGSELDTTAAQLIEARQEKEHLEEVLEHRNTEIARLRGLLAKVGEDLGLE